MVCRARADAANRAASTPETCRPFTSGTRDAKQLTSRWAHEQAHAVGRISWGLPSRPCVPCTANATLQWVGGIDTRLRHLDYCRPNQRSVGGRMRAESGPGDLLLWQYRQSCNGSLCLRTPVWVDSNFAAATVTNDYAGNTWAVTSGGVRLFRQRSALSPPFRALQSPPRRASGRSSRRPQPANSSAVQTTPPLPAVA